ncbi:hypothetical protein B0T19DRAFT_413831 [Cercophora scortea]|uniref:Riboflavin kinase n=1 Tax=Cercophora scortea TaxID=314031 RepID=A0AAE0IUZ9_9PEZI|nr:hypothetical protein B0T19DRAFT_413831 [Cercophora scortea]
MSQPTSPEFRRKQVATPRPATARADSGMESTSPPPPPYSLLAESSQPTRPEMRSYATTDPVYNFNSRGEFTPDSWERPVSRNRHGYHDAPQSENMRPFATTSAWNSSNASHNHHDPQFSQTPDWNRPVSRNQNAGQQSHPHQYQAYNPSNQHHPHERDEYNDPNHNWQRPVSRNQDAPQSHPRPYYPGPAPGWNPHDHHHHQRETFKDMDGPNHWERPVSRGDQHEAPYHHDNSPSHLGSLHPPTFNRLRVMTSLPNLLSHHTSSPLTPSSAATLPFPYPSPTLANHDLKPALPLRPHPTLPTTTSSSSSETNNYNNNNNNKSIWTTALTSTRDLATSLLPLATESTKDYTILRHSPPLIFYRGPSTSVTLTLLSATSHPLPSSRTLWLQQRGFSGDSGMKLKAALGATSTWLDVTPTTQISHPSELDPEMERRWVRDIARVLKRDPTRRLVVRETHVIRIPEASTDGYFRVVLCAGGDGKGGRKVLCPSPVFRIASTAADASVFRGASLATMPLEVGVKVASVFASTVVNRYAGPVVGVVQGQVQRVKPGFVATEAGRRVLSRLGSGPSGGIQDKNGEGENGEVERGLEVIGGDEGPVAPFPVKFQGRVVKGTGKSAAEMGLPTASLVNVPEDVKHSLRGVYFGWSCVLPERGFEHISAAWHEAIITVGPSPYAKPTVVPETVVTAHLFHDFGHETTFYDARVKVIVMGFLRPGQNPETAVSQQERLDAVSRDVIVAYSSLSRENWGPEVAVSRLKTSKSARSLAERYGGARDRVQQQVESFPVHLVGIRTASGEARDQVHGNGGYWVAR